MKEKGKRIVRKLRNVTVLGLAGCALVCGGMQSDAATLKDVFDEYYYADTYEDLKEAFGYDKEALWNHFVTQGLDEGRNMNGLIDIVKYREQYEDLQDVIGDDWDAYLNHYLAFGAKEGRDTGTDFNALDYARRYEDLQEAFGDDILALWNHYQASGVTEGREARPEAVIVAEKEAQRAAEEARGRQESQEAQDSQSSQEPQAHTEREETSNGWIIREYDGVGNMIRLTTYDADGRDFNSAQKIVKSI